MTIKMHFIFNFGNYLFSGWTPSPLEWARSGINKPFTFPELTVEISGG